MRVVLVVVVAIAAGCATPPPLISVGDANRTGVDLAELVHGRDMLIQKCSGCHRTPLPSQHVAADWPVRLDEMAQRSHLDAGQRNAIEAYLVALAR